MQSFASIEEFRGRRLSERMDAWIERPELAQLIATRVAQRPVVVLTGIRQVGKRALLRHLFPSHRYLTLDLPSLAEAAEAHRISC